MSNAQTTSNILAGATISGSALGWMNWITVNSVALTVIIVAATGVASIALNFWSKRVEHRLAQEANDIARQQNRRKTDDKKYNDNNADNY